MLTDRRKVPEERPRRLEREPGARMVRDEVPADGVGVRFLACGEEVADQVVGPGKGDRHVLVGRAASRRLRPGGREVGKLQGQKAPRPWLAQVCKEPFGIVGPEVPQAQPLRLDRLHRSAPVSAAQGAPSVSVGDRCRPPHARPNWRRTSPWPIRSLSNL